MSADSYKSKRPFITNGRSVLLPRCNDELTLNVATNYAEAGEGAPKEQRSRAAVGNVGPRRAKFPNRRNAAVTKLTCSGAWHGYVRLAVNNLEEFEAAT